MRVLVVTVVHHPEDSRIRARQIRAMLKAGWRVTYAAPFSGFDLPVPEVAGLTAIDLPRAHRRNRFAALRAARRLLRDHARDHDLVLLHDPELLLAVLALDRSALPTVVWDVHEDTAAALTAKPWLPRWARPVAAAAVRRAERWADEHVEMLLAEPSYQARFARPHAVMPNCVRVPATTTAPGDGSVVYIGSLTAARGARTLIKVGQELTARTGGAVRLRLVGSADLETQPYLRIAADSGALTWDGFLPSDRALATLDGALAGLCLLRDLPNYRNSMPTKVLEYMANGVPAVVTPLPLARELVEAAGCGLVVPFDDAEAVVDAVLRLRDDPERRRRLGEAGRAVARWQYDWAVQAPTFLAELARLSGRVDPRPPEPPDVVTSP